MFTNIGRKLLLAGLAATVAVVPAFATGKTSKQKNRYKGPVQITVRPIGPTEETMDAAKQRMLASGVVQKELSGTKFYVVSFEYIENGTTNPTDYRAVIYDYSNDRTLVAMGDFAGERAVTIRPEALQPVPSDEEFAAAVAILQQDPTVADAFANGAIKPFRPMPPTSVLEGTMQRLVNVGVDSKEGGGGRNEVVSINLKTGDVIRYPDNAPPSAIAAPEACGVPNAGQSTTSSGTAGQYQLTVTQGATTLWDMLVVRPSASSGSTKRSGIEIRNASYLGKSVFKRAHVPVLNVQYTGGQCGPYRDWQWQEGMFATPATGNTDPAPGFRVCAPGGSGITALENGTDTGNFKGVAVYTQNNETVLVTELEAGWYRYIMEWRFANNGDIHPRFGFGATDNSCVCFSHTHHVYWRFDFDIVQPTNRAIIVNNTRGLKPPLQTEVATDKDTATSKSILIGNSAGSEQYLLKPSLSDGIVDSFGVHDLWVLQYHSSGGNPTELEDGITCTTCSTAFIQIDPFVNSESVLDQDIVVWYGAHFLHNDGGNRMDPSRSPSILSGSHVVGPDLLIQKW